MIKLLVTRHDGPTEEVEVETYDAQTIADQINDSQLIAIAIGNQVFTRIDIKHVKEFEEATA